MKKLIALKAELVRQSITSLKLCQDLAINSCVFSLYINGWRKMPKTIKREIAQYLKIEPNKIFDDY